jgi:hypothetical protein
MLGKQVVVTEKMDGENTSIYNDGVHARSLDGRTHSSRSWVKQLQAQIRYQLPDGLRLCGENLYAQHSIRYDELDSYFYLFSVWENRRCLSWNDTLSWADRLGLAMPPVLYEGLWDEKALQALIVNTASSEGYVVRLREAFLYQDFASSIAKWVRAGHVQTDDHWMFQEVVPNQLREDSEDAVFDNSSDNGST